MPTTLRSKRLVQHGCPRCGGDLLLEEDDYACLQCGRIAVRLNDRFVARSALPTTELMEEPLLIGGEEKEHANVAA